MTAATLSHSSSRALPWYRQRWPWLLMLGPGLVVIAGLITLWLALRSEDGLVADDYYKRGLAINQTLERSARSADLGLRATVDVQPDGTAFVALHGNAALPPVVRLRLIHPTRAGLDHVADLVRGPDGRYAGRFGEISAGRWLVSLDTRDWRLGPVETAAGAVHIELPGEATQ